MSYLERIRETNPLIHNITNIVVANYSANGLLALGASPLMSANIHEMPEIIAISNGLVLNIGTITPNDFEAMLVAGKSGNQKGIPVVLEPVGVGASACRKTAVETILSQVKVAVIRGNAGEIACLAGINWQAKGVDAGSGSASLSEMAQIVAKKYGCLVFISGATDVISDGIKITKIHNGTPMFAKITGSGCLLSAVCTAFLSVAPPEHYFEALLEAGLTYAVAGEITSEALLPNQYGDFAVKFLNQLAAINPQMVAHRSKIE